MHIATTHKNADFDALASLVAAAFLYPGLLGVLPGQIRDNVKAFLALHRDLFPLAPRKGLDLSCVSRLVVVDANSWKRLDRMDTLVQCPNIHVWDHHLSGGDIRGKMVSIQPLGANVTQMVEEMHARDCAFSPIQATLFLMGIYEDTGKLSYPSTTSRDAAAAAFLLENGADLNVAGSYLSASFDAGQAEVLTAMLEKDELVKISGYTVGLAGVRLEQVAVDLAPIVSEYLEIKGADAAFGVFRLDQQSTIVIGRSKGSDLDVGRVVCALGGGGHAGAGSALLKSGRFDEIRDKVRELIQEMDRPRLGVSEIMSGLDGCLAPDIQIREARDILDKRRARAALVLSGDRCVGVISEAELGKARSESQLNSPVKAFMRREVPCVHPEQSLHEVMGFFSDMEIPMLPVVKDGTAVGVLTRSDLLLQLYHNF
ncbi:MAG: CBS domain-containing protein [Desulfonatronovibrionaceae bacterium]